MPFGKNRQKSRRDKQTDKQTHLGLCTRLGSPQRGQKVTTLFRATSTTWIFNRPGISRSIQCTTRPFGPAETTSVLPRPSSPLPRCALPLPRSSNPLTTGTLTLSRTSKGSNPLSETHLPGYTLSLPRLYTLRIDAIRRLSRDWE
jgi:hypothetical protein